jgi:hypothetical protein
MQFPRSALATGVRGEWIIRLLPDAEAKARFEEEMIANHWTLVGELDLPPNPIVDEIFFGQRQA